MSNKTTVIHHSADFDGLFCREIARKFLPDAELIGWDFGDAPLDSKLLHSGNLVILDLPVDRPFGLQFKDGWICRGDEQMQPIDRWDSKNVTWIDHHKTSIESHPTDIPGLRIEGVAACRLAWQWFTTKDHAGYLDKNWSGACKSDFVDRVVTEPFAVRLAGEYDIWDKRDRRAELFQHGLKSRDMTDYWQDLFGPNGEQLVKSLLESGRVIQFVRDNEYRDVITQQGFDIQWEGLTFLACCSHECDIRSHLFAAGIKPHHDALFGFTYTGKEWRVSMYHAPGKEHHDLSLIAKKHKGGGHAGACGMLLPTLPFLT